MSATFDVFFVSRNHKDTSVLQLVWQRLRPNGDLWQNKSPRDIDFPNHISNTHCAEKNPATWGEDFNLLFTQVEMGKSKILKSSNVICLISVNKEDDLWSGFISTEES